jgi:peroxiredoxin
MSQNFNKPRDRKIGTKQPEKKTLIDPRYKNLVYTIITIVVIAVFFVINNSRSEPEQGPYPPGYNEKSEAVSQEIIAPEFILTSTDGQQIKLSDYKGKIVLLDFWATWCGPCRMAVPDLVSLKSQYKSKDVEIIGISLDQEGTKDEVIPFIKEYKINYPVVYGTMKTAMDYGNISSIPTSFIINKDGKIAASFLGVVEKSKYQNKINQLLKSSKDI